MDSSSVLYGLVGVLTRHAWLRKRRNLEETRRLIQRREIFYIVFFLLSGSFIRGKSEDDEAKIWRKEERRAVLSLSRWGRERERVTEKERKRGGWEVHVWHIFFFAGFL